MTTIEREADGHVVIEPDSQLPQLWRCENDRQLHPMAVASYVLYIEEIGQVWHHVKSGTIKRRPFFVRRMVVCHACHRSLLDTKGTPE